MGLSTLIPLVVFLTLVGGSIYCIINAGGLPVVARVLAVVPLAGVTFFSIFGFLASGEPGVSPLWKVGYVVLFLACSLAVLRLAISRPHVSE